MSLFMPKKRKGRRISDIGDTSTDSSEKATEGEQGLDQEEVVAPTALRFGKRQPKKSSLRRVTNLDDVGASDPDDTNTTNSRKDKDAEDEESDDGPAVIRPTVHRGAASKRGGRKPLVSRSSSALEDAGPSPGNSRKGSAAGSAATKARLHAGFSSTTTLPTRYLHDDNGDDDDRPRYDQAYLDELQSATPNTPLDLGAQNASKDGGGGSEMDWDPAELEGAVVVNASELAPPPARSSAAAAPAASILTETEIRERKERRARLAQEQDIIYLSDEDRDNEEKGYITLAPAADSTTKKKKEKRLVREDEDMCEGFDEFVEDPELAFGRKAERKAKQRRKQEMAALIDAAEGVGSDGDGAGNGIGNGGGDSSDDSEAERRAAYDDAQARAAMEGLQPRRQQQQKHGSRRAAAGGEALVIPKMKPLPNLAECLARMTDMVQALEGEIAQRQKRLADLEAEKASIAAREKEVQDIVDKAGQKYQELLVADNLPSHAADALKSVISQSPLQPGNAPPILAHGMPLERGLESLGTTPTRGSDVDDIS